MKDAEARLRDWLMRPQMDIDHVSDVCTVLDELARVREEHRESLDLHDTNAQKLAKDLIIMREELESSRRVLSVARKLPNTPFIAFCAELSLETERHVTRFGSCDEHS